MSRCAGPGNVVADSATTLALVRVGVAVPKGAPKPDISTPALVTRTLLAAKSIAYPGPAGGAAAGVTFEATNPQARHLGSSAAEDHARAGGVAAMALTAKGQVEIGVTFLSEMLDAGIDVVWPLPAEIAPPTTLVGFVSAHAKDPAAAKALLAYLSAPDAATVDRANGMEPGGKPSERIAGLCNQP
jgi:molybdate transport system substrate-binding protein